MRGIWYILESVMAVIIMASFLILIGSVYIAKPYPADMALRAYNILQGMDNQGMLRNYTESLNCTGIADAITYYSYNKSVQICDYAGSCVGSAPATANVWIGTYIVAGLSEYQPREVRFYIWPR
jgi:hypothetical protein